MVLIVSLDAHAPIAHAILIYTISVYTDMEYLVTLYPSLLMPSDIKQKQGVMNDGFPHQQESKAM